MKMVHQPPLRTDLPGAHQTDIGLPHHATRPFDIKTQGSCWSPCFKWVQKQKSCHVTLSLRLGAPASAAELTRPPTRDRLNSKHTYDQGGFGHLVLQGIRSDQVGLRARRRYGRCVTCFSLSRSSPAPHRPVTISSRHTIDSSGSVSPRRTEIRTVCTRCRCVCAP